RKYPPLPAMNIWFRRPARQLVRISIFPRESVSNPGLPRSGARHVPLSAAIVAGSRFSSPPAPVCLLPRGPGQLLSGRPPDASLLAVHINVPTSPVRGEAGLFLSLSWKDPI